MALTQQEIDDINTAFASVQTAISDLDTARTALRSALAVPTDPITGGAALRITDPVIDELIVGAMLNNGNFEGVLGHGLANAIHRKHTAGKFTAWVAAQI